MVVSEVGLTRGWAVENLVVGGDGEGESNLRGSRGARTSVGESSINVMDDGKKRKTSGSLVDRNEINELNVKEHVAVLLFQNYPSIHTSPSISLSVSFSSIAAVGNPITVQVVSICSTSQVTKCRSHLLCQLPGRLSGGLDWVSPM